ncbi:MAG: TonB-dependent receptor [Gemmatimonadota bacterium]|nr:TonB-dependent receptor [Gemmatimonadota bacterium]
MIFRHLPGRSAFSLALLAVLVASPPALGQGTGTIQGRVTRQGGTEALTGVDVSIPGTGFRAATGTDGRYALHRVPAGTHTVAFRLLGARPRDEVVVVGTGATVVLDVELAPAPVQLGEIVVETASRSAERVVEAPAAVSVIPPAEVRDISTTGQTPLALNNVPGVDIVQSGMNDFNVNARGFNSSLNRRILVLQDGRDLAIAFLGSQEWPALALPPEAFARVEMVRGPGSALYGANAFSGVLNFTTPTAREVPGTRLTLAGGELSTMRGDLHHAGVAADGRFGYRANIGYTRSDSWSRSRTRFDGTSLQTEYASATDSAVGPALEARALNGQTVDSTTGAPLGDPDALQNIYGSARFDFYAPGGSVVTLDGGAARVENEVFVTGIGRVQVTEAIRPWVRLTWAAPNYNLMAWYSGRNSLEPQYSLAAGLPLEEKSTILHVEGQYNRAFLEDRARVVLGASARNYRVNTENTLMNALNDDRSDNSFAGYTQVEYKVVPQVRLVAAARVDKGDLYTTQFSPKGAIVVSPNADHAFRFTVNRAFQTPNYSEFYLQAPAAAPTASPGLLEGGLEQYFTAVQGAPLPPSVTAGLNLDSLPWDFSAQTLALALGNADLDVEKVTGLELGYKGTISQRVFVTVDAYWSRLTNFVTDLLPGVNPAYPRYLLTDDRDVRAVLDTLDQRLAAIGLPASHPLRAPIPTLAGGYDQLNAQAGPLLATLPDGTRAIVVSYANAGKVTERGIEFGVSVALTDEFRVEGSYALFDFDVDATQTQAGDQLLPNTPKHRATGAISYRGRQGLDASVSARFVNGYSWAAGVFSGFVPSSQTVNASAGYAVNNNLRLHVTGTNLLDQQRFHLYGGSVIGRRVLGGATVAF